MTPESEKQQATSPPIPPTPAGAAPARVAVAACWAVIVAAAGGLAFGWLSGQFGQYGAIGLWGVGAIAGAGSRKITREPSVIAAWCQVAACALALVIGQVCWLHWNTVQGEESWLAAVSLLVTYFQKYQLTAAIEALFAGFGAYSAYTTAGKRYRIVREYID